jgi:tRNA A-37 threonylcarbamoyl transferase component Bud32
MTITSTSEDELSTLIEQASIRNMTTVLQVNAKDEKDHANKESAPVFNDETWLLRQTGLSTRHELSQLVKLELPDCNLTSLPDQFATLVPNLEILFCPKNKFSEVPTVIGQCLNLRMVSFKECYTIRRVPPQALQPQLQWLILTGNRLQEIPDTIRRCVKLQKLMLAGNRLTKLPPVFSELHSLELIRLACNQLMEAPKELLQLCPNLRWAAFASNPFLPRENPSSTKHTTSLPILNDPCLDNTKAEILGSGAGGITRKVVDYQHQPVAVKTFVGQLTSDGSPLDEKSISVAAASLQDCALIQLLGETTHGGLVMEYLEGYQALAEPPSFVTCSRDVYPDDLANYVSATFAWTIVTDMLRVLNKLHHELGICHADFYGHNILIHPQKQKVKLSDFGAAFFYDRTTDYGNDIERIELRAYEVLVQELHDKIILSSHTPTIDPWKALLEQCQKPDMTFDELAFNFVGKGESKKD